IPKIEGDPTQLQQILVNLIMNASDAIADRGTITVKFAVGQFVREYLETTFLHSNANPGTFVSVDVTDDGEGMTPQIMSRVFDPFFSTKESGHGLGIAAVQRIVGLHGGAVKVESEPGLGSTFRLLLRPCAYEETTLQDVDANPHSTGGGVLVADDDAQVRAAAERILVRAGYSVTVAEDGASALAYFEQHIDEIDLALLDVLMPGLDGTETLIAMRNIDPDLPVVLMSGFDRAKLDKLEDESIEFVQKPFGWHSLTSAVGRAISASPRHRAATAHSA
ncbi:MAG: ATP-binding protein, partial [Gammaproteobacteria bacterium]|nr:ATP-binding protein [Gammaproteobacteria bacterium]